LPSFAWVTPTLATSDHPRSGTDSGPPYVSDIVNCLGGAAPCAGSTYWNSTAIFLLWDDFGGLYDHIPPPLQSSAYGFPYPQGGGPGYGLRTGLIVISPYVKQPYVYKGFLTSGAILKFIEGVFNIPSMGGYDTDPNTTAIANMFDFTQAPQPFKGPFSNQAGTKGNSSRHRTPAQLRLEKSLYKAGRNQAPDTN